MSIPYVKIGVSPSRLLSFRSDSLIISLNECCDIGFRPIIEDGPPKKDFKTSLLVVFCFVM